MIVDCFEGERVSVCVCVRVRVAVGVLPSPLVSVLFSDVEQPVAHYYELCF